MSDTALAPTQERGDSTRAARPPLLAFATDPETETVIRDAFNVDLLEGAEVHRGGLDLAAKVLEKSMSPRVLLVDISGNRQPLTDLATLSQLVEPDVRVLVIGDREDLALYRGLTQGLGVVEYLFKPVTREIIAQHFVPVLTGSASTDRLLRTGRVIAVTGVHGGVGATTIATNLAWYLAERARRHTLLLDGDLYGAAASMMLSAKGRPGLRVALEHPNRVDELFIERSAQPVGERLFVLSGEGRLAEPPHIAPDAMSHVLKALRQRYKLLVCDAPFPSSPIGQAMFDAAQQRILVTDPSVAGARDALRYLAMPSPVESAGPPLLVMNMLGIQGGLDLAKFVDATARKPDLVIPYIKGTPRSAADLGEPLAAPNAGFAALIQTLASRAASVQGGIAASRRRFWGRRFGGGPLWDRQ
jgi:pilus assembly protein CpaE